MFQILVIDDDKNARFFIKEALELKKYQVTEAADGLQGLKALESIHIDLIIVDIMMPKMDGYEFTREVRRAFPNMPILMVSAKLLSEDRKKGFVAGIDDYMSKPLDFEELLLHVKALLKRYEIENERKLQINQVTLNYDSFEVTNGIETVLLPQKEFLLLYKLLSSPNKIFTRIQLMDEIWGYDCETGWETLTVHINRLRKKFDNWNAFEIIVQRNLGYKAVIKNEK